MRKRRRRRRSPGSQQHISIQLDAFKTGDLRQEEFFFPALMSEEGGVESEQPPALLGE